MSFSIYAFVHMKLILNSSCGTKYRAVVESVIFPLSFFAFSSILESRSTGVVQFVCKWLHDRGADNLLKDVECEHAINNFVSVIKVNAFNFNAFPSLVFVVHHVYESSRLFFWGFCFRLSSLLHCDGAPKTNYEYILFSTIVLRKLWFIASSAGKDSVIQAD